MAEATIKWLEEKRFVAVDSTDHGIVISVPGEEGGIGAKPSDLLLMALGGCTAVDVVGILQKKRQKLTGLEIRVTSEQQPDPPWTFQRFHVHYIVKGHELSEKAVEDAIRISHEKYCSVSSTLKLAASVTDDFEIVEDD
ncbi:MAG: OsmC family protein [Anaerolineae bacterium]|nr:OsmC family protein [Anaerolineae bacterium]